MEDTYYKELLGLTSLEYVLILVIRLLLGCILGQWLFIKSKKEDKITYRTEENKENKE